MKFINPFIFISVILFSMPGCRKDRTPAPALPGKPLLSIKLSNTYLIAAQIDSAFAIWTVNNQEQRIRLTLRNDSLFTDMGVFEEGNGLLVIHIFSNKKYRNQYPGQWLMKKTISLQRSVGSSYAGPVSFYDPAWLARVKLIDAIGHSAVVALRPDDPFFIVNTPNHPVVKIKVDRSYWKSSGAIFAGGALWDCSTGCTGVENTTFFSNLPQRIGSRPWDHIEIFILFQTDNNGGGSVLDLSYNVQ